MRRLHALTLVAALAAGLAFAVPAPASAGSLTSGLRMSGLTAFADPETGVLHIDGEITNTGPTLESVAAVIDLKNAAGQVLQTETAYASIQVLLQGGKCGFDDQTTKPAGFDHVSLNHFLAQPQTVTPSRGVTVTVDTAADPANVTTGQLLAGTVRNDEPYAIQAVKVVVSFYKADHSLAWVANTISSVIDPNVQPGETVPWSVPNHAGYPSYTSYSIAYTANENGKPLVAPLHLLSLVPVEVVSVLGEEFSNLGHTLTVNGTPNAAYVPRVPADFGNTQAAAPQLPKPAVQAQTVTRGRSYVGPDSVGATHGVAPIDFPILRTARDLLFALVALLLVYLAVRTVLRRQRRTA